MMDEDETYYKLTAKGVIMCFLAFAEDGPKLDMDEAEKYASALELDLFRRGYVINETDLG